MPKLQRAKTVACGLLRWDRCCIIVVSHWSKPAGQNMASLLVVVGFRTSHSMPKEESHVIFSKNLPLKAPARAGHGAEGGQRARAVGHPGGLRGAALRHTAERAPMVAACGRSWRGHRGTRGRCGAPAGQLTERVAGSRPRGTPREPERPGVARSPGGLGATA